MQWREISESAPKKARTVSSTGKVLATDVEDEKVVIIIVYLEKGRTLTEPYYAGLLSQKSH